MTIDSTFIEIRISNQFRAQDLYIRFLYIKFLYYSPKKYLHNSI